MLLLPLMFVVFKGEKVKRKAGLLKEHGDLVRPASTTGRANDSLENLSFFPASDGMVLLPDKVKYKNLHGL